MSDTFKRVHYWTSKIVRWINLVLVSAWSRSIKVSINKRRRRSNRTQFDDAAEHFLDRWRDLASPCLDRLLISWLEYTIVCLLHFPLPSQRIEQDILPAMTPVYTKRYHSFAHLSSVVIIDELNQKPGERRKEERLNSFLLGIISVSISFTDHPHTQGI